MSYSDRVAEDDAMLVALKAAEVELEEGPEQALAVLGPPLDPIRLRAALGILIRANRDDAAAGLIRDIEPHEKWIEWAALVFARLGRCEEALNLVETAKRFRDPLLGRKTRVAFAEGLVGLWRRLVPAETSLLAFGDWSDHDRELARSGLNVLEPMLSSVRTNDRISDDLELAAVLSAVYCSYVAGEMDFDELGKWLSKHEPVPPLVAELSLRRMIACPSDLAARLRGHHPGDFQIGFLAGIVDRELHHDPDGAFRAFTQMAAATSDHAQREAVCIALFETCGQCQHDVFDEALATVRQLRPADARIPAMLLVVKHLAAGDLPAAKAALEISRDDKDGLWWQGWAQFCERSGDQGEARAAWDRAAMLIPHPDVVRQSVQAALDQRQYRHAIPGLKKLVAESPLSTRDLRNLVSALVRVGDFAQAADYLGDLVDLQPEDAQLRLNLAQLLARCNRPDDALASLEPVLSDGDPPLQAILLNSALLATLERKSEALDSLRRVATDYWDNPIFLVAYLQQAHAAGDDRLGNEVLARRIELRSAGQVPPDVLQEGTLEQIIELGRNYIERREALQTNVVRGQAPWLFAEELLRNAPTWAWALHTQSLRWVSEEALTRAAYSIYATNGFAVCEIDGERRIEPIVAPRAGTEVVVDLTALLTLSELDRLPVVADHFYRLIVPATYGGLRMRYADWFGQHQPSREAELKAIREEIDDGRIEVIEQPPDAIVVDEYADIATYRLRDLIETLISAQAIDSESATELSRIAHKASGINENRGPIEIGDTVVVDLSTLRAIAGRAGFKQIVESFDLKITQDQQKELATELQARKRSFQAKQAHDRLWDTLERLRQDGKVAFVPITATGEEGEEDEDGFDAPTVHLDSVKLASELNKPLLADDRVVQVLAHQGNPSAGSTAFGSDKVLIELSDKDDAMRCADDVLQLMKWRYRFILPSSTLLLHWAKGAGAALPGDRLLAVSAYGHDCLADPGLHCGAEPTVPPMPMALKFAVEWNNVVIRFLSMAWAEAQFDDSTAEQLTTWAGQEMVASCPRGLWLQPRGETFAQLLPEAVMTFAFALFTNVADLRRANLGLRNLAGALGMDRDQFLTFAARAVHAFRER
jgi:Tfp pilus assembly protein PilF